MPKSAASPTSCHSSPISSLCSSMARRSTSSQVRRSFRTAPIATSPLPKRFPAKGRDASTCDVWPQVEDEADTDEAEREARRDERDQHGGSEGCKDDERTTACHAPRALGRQRTRIGPRR